MEQNSEGKWKWKVTATLKEVSADQIWPFFKDFFNINKWFPGAPTCYGVYGTNGEVGCIRYCAGFAIPSVDGSISWAKERLVAVDPTDRVISYEIVDCNTGFKSYVATFKIVPGGGGGGGDEDDGQDGRCVIEWVVTVDPVQEWRFGDLVNKYELGLQLMAEKMEDDALALGISQEASQSC